MVFLTEHPLEAWLDKVSTESGSSPARKGKVPGPDRLVFVAILIVGADKLNCAIIVLQLEDSLFAPTELKELLPVLRFRWILNFRIKQTL